MDAIVVDNLTKTYKNGVQALSGVSFTVKPGEIFGLLGPNGAGKSTTVRILSTLSQPDGGQAFVAGHNVVSEPQAVRHSIGVVAQSSGVDVWGTGRENLTLQANIQRVPSSEIKDRVSQLLEWVGLSDAADRLVNTYSGGMKRRLDIAIGLVHEPAVLFLDEPTTGLDPESRSALWRDLVRLREERELTVLLTTHYLEEADRLCDRLAIVDHGQVVVEGTPANLKSQILGDTVTIELASQPRAVVDILQPLEGVLEVIPNGTTVITRVTQGATAVPALITALEHAGVTAQAVTLSRPSLDDVYLHHTGHRFTAEAETEANDAVGQGGPRS